MSEAVCLFADSLPLLPERSLSRLVEGHPFFFFSDSFDVSYPANFVDLRLRLILENATQRLFEVPFSLSQEARPLVFSNLFPWDFPDPKKTAPSPPVVLPEVELPWTALFLPAGDLVEAVAQQALESASNPQKMAFIHSFRAKSVLTTKTGREVDPRALLRNLLEFGEALKAKQEFEIHRTNSSD